MRRQREKHQNDSACKKTLPVSATTFSDHSGPRRPALNVESHPQHKTMLMFDHPSSFSPSQNITQEKRPFHPTVFTLWHLTN